MGKGKVLAYDGDMQMMSFLVIVCSIFGGNRVCLPVVTITKRKSYE